MTRLIAISSGCPDAAFLPTSAIASAVRIPAPPRPRAADSRAGTKLFCSWVEGIDATLSTSLCRPFTRTSPALLTAWVEPIATFCSCIDASTAAWADSDADLVTTGRSSLSNTFESAETAPLTSPPAVATAANSCDAMSTVDWAESSVAAETDGTPTFMSSVARINAA